MNQQELKFEAERGFFCSVIDRTTKWSLQMKIFRHFLCFNNNNDALINALSAHMIHIHLNMIFCTYVEHSPTKSIYIKYYTEKHALHTHTHTHNDCSRNWVLILVGIKILWEEDGFQFGFKRWKDWAVSKVLWEWIAGVGSKARAFTASSVHLSFKCYSSLVLDFNVTLFMCVLVSGPVLIFHFLIQ